ncbi:hypothetical protein NPIL_234981 [Nephila pilipes]|uniref:Uncharacterized protein n=1 Tax=Nephila pilipes TaxID=299642 RepID=A0A8X6J312_NEPPI|nr:hypothetical protein NPIL_234981 [Nephila pilipes]
MIVLSLVSLCNPNYLSRHVQAQLRNRLKFATVNGRTLILAAVEGGEEREGVEDPFRLSNLVESWFGIIRHKNRFVSPKSLNSAVVSRNSAYQTSKWLNQKDAGGSERSFGIESECVPFLPDVAESHLKE